MTTSGVIVSVQQILPNFRILGYLRDPRDWKTKATWYGEIQGNMIGLLTCLRERKFDFGEFFYEEEHRQLLRGVRI